MYLLTVFTLCNSTSVTDSGGDLVEPGPSHRPRNSKLKELRLADCRNMSRKTRERKRRIQKFLETPIYGKFNNAQ